MITVEKRKNGRGEEKVFVRDNRFPENGNWPVRYDTEEYIAECSCREGCPGRKAIRSTPVYTEDTGIGATIASFTQDQTLELYHALGKLLLGEQSE